MSIANTLRKLFEPMDRHTTSIVPLTKETAAFNQKSFDIYAPNGVRLADWSSVSTTAYLEASRKSVAVYACINLYARAITDAPLRVYQRDNKGNVTERPEHRVRQIIAEPNPKMNETELFALVTMQMGYHGYAVLEKVRSARGLTVELWPLMPGWLTSERGSDGSRRFAYRIPRNPVRYIDESDLIIIPWQQDPNMGAFGISPLHVAQRELGIEIALTDILKVFLDNGAIPPFVFEYPEEITDRADIEAFQLAWLQKYGKNQGYAVPPVLHGGYKITKVGDGISDMAWPDLRNITELKIAQAFGVPPDLIGAMKTLEGGSLTTTEMEGALRLFQINQVQPLRTYIEGKLTKHLLREYVGSDSTYELKFDLSEIYFLQENQNAVETRALAAYDSGAITLNQFLAETGRPTVGPAGDVYKVPFTSMFVRLQDLAGAAEENRSAPVLEAGYKVMELPSGQTRKYRDEKALSLAELEFRASQRNRTARDKDKLMEIGARKLRVHFREQGKRLIEKLEKADELGLEGKNITPLDWDIEYDLIKEVMMRFYNETGSRAYKTTSELVGVALNWDQTNPGVSRVLSQLGTYIVGINETTRQEVARVISEASQEGLTTTQTADKLKGLFNETYKNRARAIAHTETIKGYALAQVEAYTETGQVDEAELFDNPAHDTDPGSDGLTCAERNGLVVNLSDVPRHIEAEHPNGSIAFAAILKKPLGEV